MMGMFSNCIRLNFLDISNFKTPSLTNMESMFERCLGLTSLNLSNFNTSSVTNMNNLFCESWKLKNLDINNFDTSLVIYMDSMFSHTGLTSLDLKHFNTDSVKSMARMFSSNQELTSINLCSFNTSAVINMEKMFMFCENIESLNLINFDTSSVTNFEYMFYSCTNLKSLNIYNFDTSLNPIIEDIFEEILSNLTLCYNPIKAPYLVDYSSNFENNCIKLCCEGNNSYCFNYFKCTDTYETYNTEGAELSDSIRNDFMNHTNISDNAVKKTEYSNEDIYNESNILYNIEELNIIEPVKNETNDIIMKYFIEYLNNVDSDIILNEINKGKDIVYKINELEIHITNTENQINNKNKNETNIILGDCENILKDSYNISYNESLIIYKVDILKENWKIPKIEYSVYYPLNGSKLYNLNLSKCDKSKINILIPILINEKDIDK